MPGTLIVSLDCEGKWGMADKIGPHHEGFLTNEALVDAYRRLLALFARHEVPATFAFVMAFTLSEREREAALPLFRDREVEGRNWLRHFREAEAQGRADGWFCPKAFDLVQAQPQHELACHGFCHLPLAEHLTREADAAEEIAAATVIARRKGIALDTFVYPRNQVGYVHLLKRAGFRGYRAPPRNRLGRGRLAGLLTELDCWAPSQQPEPIREELAVIPGGCFFNWRAGLRRAVPPAVTLRRWSAMLHHAAESGGVAHLWLHPHNIIDGPGTLEVLDRVLEKAAALRRRGTLTVQTQRDHCAAAQADVG